MIWKGFVIAWDSVLDIPIKNSQYCHLQYEEDNVDLSSFEERSPSYEGESYSSWGTLGLCLETISDVKCP